MRFLDAAWRRCLTDETQAGRRSLLGALVAIAMLPALVGVMGCIELPAPIGDPEKSRIDPALSGLWIGRTADDEPSVTLLYFEPYDKRSWLLRWIVLEVVQDAGNGTPAVGGEPAVRLLQAGLLKPDSLALFKTWRTRIGGESFLTMELRGQFNAATFGQPEVWWGAKVAGLSEERLELHFISNEFGEFESGMGRRQLERVIRQHRDDPALYTYILPSTLQRVPEEAFGIVAGMLEELGVAATY